MAMHVVTFNKPGLARPLIRSHWFVVERHAKVIDPLITCGSVVWITEKVLLRRTNPAFFLHMIRRERGDPFLSIAAVTLLLILGPRIGGNLWPMVVVLHVQGNGDVKIAQVYHALHALRSRTH